MNEWRVGAGRYLYFYANRGNVSYLRGLGYAAGTAALCFWLAPTVIGAIACGAGAYIIYEALIAGRGLPAYGYCREVRLRYSGSLVGVRDIRRSC